MDNAIEIRRTGRSNYEVVADMAVLASGRSLAEARGFVKRLSGRWAGRSVVESWQRQLAAERR